MLMLLFFLFGSGEDDLLCVGIECGRDGVIGGSERKGDLRSKITMDSAVF